MNVADELFRAAMIVVGLITRKSSVAEVASWCDSRIVASTAVPKLLTFPGAASTRIELRLAFAAVSRPTIDCIGTSASESGLVKPAPPCGWRMPSTVNGSPPSWTVWPSAL